MATTVSNHAAWGPSSVATSLSASMRAKLHAKNGGRGGYAGDCAELLASTLPACEASVMMVLSSVFERWFWSAGVR
ncbi:unnamed protein product [Gemmata massiliana]|uniref:Uncharacterized protein n=1 Tax=Gemmata massiliana TaxID=1210884 RepID=A0A6P2D7X0_9BACT|nr:unnamed protein product [Gemmata massiliana]